MERLEDLRNRLREAEMELDRITIKSHHSTQWAPGVQDQFHSESYTTENYTDVSKAYRLKGEIKELRYKIDNYAMLAQRQRAQEEAIRDMQIPKYSYVAGGQNKTTTNPAIAASYEAQHRMFGLSKMKKVLSKVNGQKAKFEKLWREANTTNKQKQQEIANELNQLFR